MGVSRQWAGTIGKVDNCQVGVFAVLGHAAHATPIDCRLHGSLIPSGVPAHRVKLLRKHDLAWKWLNPEGYLFQLGGLRRFLWGGSCLFA